MTWYGAYIDPPLWWDDLGKRRPAGGLEESFQMAKAEGPRIICSFSVCGHEVRVNRLGGIFVHSGTFSELKIPATIRDASEREYLQYRDWFRQSADVVNLVLCGVTLQSQFARLVDESSIAPAEVNDEHARSPRARGGREAQIAGAENGMDLIPHRWDVGFESALHTAVEQIAVVEKLCDVSPSLPPFVVAAGFAQTVPRMPGAERTAHIRSAGGIVDSWIVCEMLIGHLWKRDYIVRAIDAGHRKRLNDNRTFGSSQRIEMLHAIGVLRHDTYQLIQKARKIRNDLAHEARAPASAPHDCFSAMRRLIFDVFDDHITGRA